MADRDKLAQIMAEILDRLQSEKSIDQRIAEAETPSQLEAIMAEREAAMQAPAEELPAVEEVGGYADYERRAKKFNDDLEALETPDEIARYMMDNQAEVVVLTQAEVRLNVEEDQEAIDKINAAETPEELRKLTGDAPESHEEWLQNRLKENDS